MKKVSVYIRQDRLEAAETRRDYIPGVVSRRISDEMHGFDTHILGPSASEEEVAAFLARPPPKTFDEFVSEMRGSLNATLAAGGWPPGDQYVLVQDDKWELASAHDLKRFSKVNLSMGSFYVLERCAPFSQEWFLAKLSDALRTVESSTGDRKVWAVFNFARMLEALEHRVHYQKVRKAVKNKRDAAAGGYARARSMKGRTDKILAEMRRRIEAGHSVERAAALCAKVKIGSSPAANARLWRRHN